MDWFLYDIGLRLERVKWRFWFSDQLLCKPVAWKYRIKRVQSGRATDICIITYNLVARSLDLQFQLFRLQSYCYFLHNKPIRTVRQTRRWKQPSFLHRSWKLKVTKVNKVNSKTNVFVLQLERIVHLLLCLVNASTFKCFYLLMLILSILLPSAEETLYFLKDFHLYIPISSQDFAYFISHKWKRLRLTWH